MLRFLTAGESHGMGLSGIIEGLPAGLVINEQEINHLLERRQKSYGRGNRMKIEKDQVKLVGGIYGGRTIGSPLALYIENQDWSCWNANKRSVVTVPRPGHADLAGAVKYGFDDLQKVIERASARETAMRTAIGGVAKILLSEFGVEIIGFVTGIGKVSLKKQELSLLQLMKSLESSPVFCPDEKTSELMCKQIDNALFKKNTLGGSFQVIVNGAPPGLGSYVQWDRRLDGRLSQAILSIPSVKGVEIGPAIENSGRYGSQVQDEIFVHQGKIFRKTNSAGGIEGGVSNGEQILLRGFVKPVPTLLEPLNSVDLQNKKPCKAPLVRSDVCVVPAISVIAEAVVAWEIASAFVEKFGGDSLGEMKTNYHNYRKHCIL